MNKILWIDMEMTGLDVEHEVVIEVAAIVTDLHFQELDCIESVVKQPEEFLEHMDDWNRDHHSKSGLLAKVPQGISPEMMELKLIDLAKKHFPENTEKPILAGNSISQDRAFINRYFPSFAKRLHYRMLDVSSWKIIYRNVYGYEYKKGNHHRALDDIRESIEELKAYMNFIDLKKSVPLTGVSD